MVNKLPPALASGLIAFAGAPAAAGDGSALERPLLLDAAARASLQAGPVGGHDGKFFLGSADGDYRLQFSGQVQMRYHLTGRDAEAPDEDLTNGFNMRRVKLGMEGVVAGEWEYKVVGAFSRSRGTFDLEDAYVSRSIGENLDLTFGQFKPPLLREENISSKYQLTVDRSVVNEVFNQDWNEGVALTHETDRVRVGAVVSDGIRTRYTPYYSPAEADFAATGRVDFRLGEAPWKVFSDFTSFRGGPTGSMIGGAVHWQTSGDTANTDTFAGTAAAETDLLLYTVDASYEGGGWNLYGAFVGRSTDTGDEDFDDFGGLVQGGVFVTDQTEIFGRWDAVFPDDSRENGDEFHTLTAGANYYFVPGSRAAKLTADVVWYLDDQAGSSSLVRVNEGIGLAPSDEDGQYTVRVQMQILF